MNFEVNQTLTINKDGKKITFDIDKTMEPDLLEEQIEQAAFTIGANPKEAKELAIQAHDEICK